MHARRQDRLCHVRRRADNFERILLGRALWIRQHLKLHRHARSTGSPTANPHKFDAKIHCSRCYTMNMVVTKKHDLSMCPGVSADALEKKAASLRNLGSQMWTATAAYTDYTQRVETTSQLPGQCTILTGRTIGCCRSCIAPAQFGR